MQSCDLEPHQCPQCFSVVAYGKSQEETLSRKLAVAISFIISVEVPKSTGISEGSATINWADRDVLSICATPMVRVCLPDLWRHVAAVRSLPLKPGSIVRIDFSSPVIQGDMGLIFISSGWVVFEDL